MSAIARRVVLMGNPVADRSKYGNKKTTRHGITFASKKEAEQYDKLLFLEKHGRVRNIRLQVRYDFRVNGILIAYYLADFVYEELGKDGWVEVVHDTKGFPAKTWPMKKKLLKAIHGIDVRVT